MTQSQLSEREVERRVPSLSLIDDRQTREETRRLTREAPQYFWERPGSRRGYHNAHEHGLWKHTLKLSTVIDRLADSWIKQGYISQREVDDAHAAAILHDQRKEGAVGGQTARDHDLQMAAVIRESSSLNKSVEIPVKTHMVPWYEGPKPSPGTTEDLVHIADMVASTDAIDIRLPAPVPNELQPYSRGETRLR